MGISRTRHALHQENTEALDHQYVEHHLAPGGFDGRLCLEPSFFAENNLVPPTVCPRCMCDILICVLVVYAGAYYLQFAYMYTYNMPVVGCRPAMLLVRNTTVRIFMYLCMFVYLCMYVEYLYLCMCVYIYVCMYIR